MHTKDVKREDFSKEEQEFEAENESSRLSSKKYYEYSYNNKNEKQKCYKRIVFFFISGLILVLFFGMSLRMINIINNISVNRNKNDYINNLILNISDETKNNTINSTVKMNILNDNISINILKNISDNSENNINNFTTNNIINNTTNRITNNIISNNPEKKIGLAFLYSSLFSNGIARFITVTANYLIKTGKYDICFITSKPYHKEFTYNSSIKRFIALNNYSLIRNISKYENIDIFILQNVISSSAVKFYHSIGKKVIGMFHGCFMSAMAMDHLNSYKNWNDFDLFDSYVFIDADDYYFYKKLGFKNELYIPNLNTFVPSETKSSNLTYNNIIMLGRQNDPIKGAKYAVKSMIYVTKEVPDARLTLVTSDSRIQFLKDLIKRLNLTNNVFINYHTYNISSCFWNSSVLMYTSFSEAYPMAMNEGKAHGMPIVAFDVPYSPPYQKGVIVVDQLDCEALARETIKLLKDYDYRKKMGEKAKESLSEYSNDEIAEIWGKLFRALLSNDTNEYRQLQNEIENKYYNEDEARIRMHRSYELLKRVNKNLTCHYVENFTDINYVKNIKLCNISNNDSFRNLL